MVGPPRDGLMIPRGWFVGRGALGLVCRAPACVIYTPPCSPQSGSLACAVCAREQQEAPRRGPAATRGRPPPLLGLGCVLLAAITSVFSQGCRTLYHGAPCAHAFCCDVFRACAATSEDYVTMSHAFAVEQMWNRKECASSRPCIPFTQRWWVMDASA